MDAFLNAVQWPALVITLIAAWLVGSESKKTRSLGFWSFVAAKNEPAHSRA